MNQHKDLPSGSQAWAKKVDDLMEENKHLLDVVRRLCENAGLDYSNPKRGLNTGGAPSTNNPVGQKLSSLADVKTYDVADKQVLTWSQMDQRWLPATPVEGAVVDIPEEIVYYGDYTFRGIGDWPDIAGNVWAFTGFSPEGTWQAQGTHSVNLVAGRWNATDGSFMYLEMTEAPDLPEINFGLEHYGSGKNNEIQFLPNGIYIHGRFLRLPQWSTANRPTGLTSGDNDKGAMGFDLTLGIPIIWNGSGWINFTGTAV